MTTSCHILSKLSFTNHHINNTIVLKYWQICETNTQECIHKTCWKCLALSDDTHQSSWACLDRHAYEFTLWCWSSHSLYSLFVVFCWHCFGTNISAETPPYKFIVWCLIKHRAKVTFFTFLVQAIFKETPQ